MTDDFIQVVNGDDQEDQGIKDEAKNLLDSITDRNALEDKLYVILLENKRLKTNVSELQGIIDSTNQDFTIDTVPAANDEDDVQPSILYATVSKDILTDAASDSMKKVDNKKRVNRDTADFAIKQRNFSYLFICKSRYKAKLYDVLNG